MHVPLGFDVKRNKKFKRLQINITHTESPHYSLEEILHTLNFCTISSFLLWLRLTMKYSINL